MSSIRDFVPLTKLGEGSFSTVYKVRRLSDQKIYALKKVRMSNLTQKQKQNALNEIRILASFDCHNIVAYKEAFFDDKLNVLCIVMEFADGGDLQKMIADTKKDFRAVSEITIWKIAADIISALEHLHSKGILHRDLKSANIFVHGDEYKLGDLNVSKVNGGRLAYTQTGTPYYASPEVWRDQPYDNKSDIWSFGCILYELASLKPPFQGADMDELFRNIQKTTYTPIPPQYSLELAEVIELCLQKNPKCRPKATQLLEHAVISRFRNRKNNPIDETQSQKELLQTIKLPADLRALKMNLPGAKYDDSKKKQLVESKVAEKIADVRNYASDRSVLQNKSEVVTSIKQSAIFRNQSHLINYNAAQSPKGIQPQSYLSPRNTKKPYDYSRAVQQLINRKVASAQISNSEKKGGNNSQDYSDRKYRLQSDQNYSERRINSQKKSAIMDKYGKFVQEELERKPVVMPRTEKRIVSSQNGSQNSSPYVPVPQPAPGSEKRQLEEVKKRLVKKSRVFSNNIFLNRPITNSNHQLR